MISFGNFGTGKILYSSLKVHCKSPHSWPSSCGKKQFLHSRLRRSWRNCFSPRLLTHSWGDLQCTFRDSQKILNSYTRGFATRIGIFQSQNCQMISLGQSSQALIIVPYTRRHFIILSKIIPHCFLDWSNYFQTIQGIQC